MVKNIAFIFILFMALVVSSCYKKIAASLATKQIPASQEYIVVPVWAFEKTQISMGLPLMLGAAAAYSYDKVDGTQFTTKTLIAFAATTLVSSYVEKQIYKNKNHRVDDTEFKNWLHKYNKTNKTNFLLNRKIKDQYFIIDELEKKRLDIEIQNRGQLAQNQLPEFNSQNFSQKEIVDMFFPNPTAKTKLVTGLNFINTFGMKIDYGFTRVNKVDGLVTGKAEIQFYDSNIPENPIAYF